MSRGRGTASTAHSSAGRSVGIALTAAAILAAVLLGALTAHARVLAAPAQEWNDGRLAPALGLLMGVPLYAPGGHGVILGNVYGPLAAVAYLPAVAGAASPMEAMRRGSLLSILWILLPTAWLMRRAGVALGAALPAAGLLVAYADVSRILSGPLFNVHADAPALGWGILACAELLPEAGDARRQRRGVLVAGAALAFAVGSKQVMLLAIPAAATYLWLTGRDRLAGQMFVAIAAASVVSLLLVSTVAELGDLWFNAVVVNARHPWRDGRGVVSAAVQGMRDLVPRIAAPLLVWVMAAWPSLRKPGWRRWVWKPWFLPLWVAGWNLPLSLFGRAKIGGSLNTLSFTALFVVLAAMLAVGELARGGTRGRAGASAIGLACALAVTVAGHAGNPAAGVALAERAWEFVRRHPQEVYLPFHPLYGMMADGRAYHFSDGVYARELAGFAVDSERFRSFLPGRLRWVVTSPGRRDYALRFLPECDQVVEIPELRGWKVYECRRPS